MSWGKSKSVIVAGVVAFLSAFGALWFFSHPLPLPLVPDQNGYDALTGILSNAAPGTFDFHRRLEDPALLDRIHDSMTNEIVVPLEELHAQGALGGANRGNQLLMLTTSLVATGKKRSGDGEFDRAAETLMDAIHIGAGLVNTGAAIDHHVAAQTIPQACAELSAGVRGMTPDQARVVLERLTTYSRTLVPPKKVDRVIAAHYRRSQTMMHRFLVWYELARKKRTVDPFAKFRARRREMQIANIRACRETAILFASRLYLDEEGRMPKSQTDLIPKHLPSRMFDPKTGGELAVPADLPALPGFIGPRLPEL